MAEQPLPPPEERLTIAQAAELLGKSTKAVQQLVARKSLKAARENVNPRTGRASRVVTIRSWIEDYAGGALVLAPTPTSTPERESQHLIPKTWLEQSPSPEGHWQEIAERQASRSSGSGPVSRS